VADDVKARRGLTTDRVVHAAQRAADQGGIEAVSLRRLAAALDVTPMAIYRHVRNKSHLLDLMAERLLEQVDLAPDESATWQDRLRRLLASYQAVVAAHPAAPLLLSRPFVSQAAPRASEALLSILHSAGFDAGQSARVLQVITGMLLGPAIHRATWAAASSDRPLDAARQQASVEDWSADAYPLSSAAAQFMDWSAGADADRLTIELLVGGLEALADQPNRGEAARRLGDAAPCPSRPDPAPRYGPHRNFRPTHPRLKPRRRYMSGSAARVVQLRGRQCVFAWALGPVVPTRHQHHAVWEQRGCVIVARRIHVGGDGPGSAARVVDLG
jgi:AcrR family transcriptional regulator